jgi:maltooligosyltrehalose synthase
MVPPGAWRDTHLQVPTGTAARRFRQAFTGGWVELVGEGTDLPVERVLDAFPVALLWSDATADAM